ncbi:MAG: hypothetical protein AAGA31_11025, partial [Bacteroidota bacterium]
MLRSLLLGAVCLLWASSAIAQTNKYYWADNSRVALSASKTHFIITADDATTLTSAQPSDLKRYESWPHKPYAVVESNTDLTVD